MEAISKIKSIEAAYFDTDFTNMSQDTSLSLDERLANAIAQRTADSEQYKSWRHEKLAGKVDATSLLELQMGAAQYNVTTSFISATVKKLVDIPQTLVKG